QKIMEIYLKAWKYGLKATYYAFMPAKIKTEGKYVHEDLKDGKETPAGQNRQDSFEAEAFAEITKPIKPKTTNGNTGNTSHTGMTGITGNTGNIINSGNLMPLDELMKEKGYCEECGN
ncbi:MAG: hypothetical protein RXO36_04195, partial [Candidatus Nanopusillus acidilobi]